jgi:hypothetical protein
MDADRFDALARRVASGSRRQLLGGLLAGLGATFGIHAAAAQKKERGSEQDTQPDPAHAPEQDPPREQPTAKSKDSPPAQDTGSVGSPDTEQDPPPDQQPSTHDQSKDKQQDKQQDHPHGKQHDTSDTQEPPHIQQDKQQEKRQDREQTQETSAKNDDADKPQAKSENPDKQQDHPHGKRHDTSDTQEPPHIQQDKPRDNHPKSQLRDRGDRKDQQQAQGGSDQKENGGKGQGGGTPCDPSCATRCCSGTCCPPNATTCNQAGLCCEPNCAGRQCGPDGCGRGGKCGTCPSGERCDEASGQCSGCVPNCQGKACGDDRCGGSCGTCPAGTSCDAPSGQCRSDCGAQRCPKGCCQDGQCRGGDTDSVCGTGGEPCLACGTGQSCCGGTCVNTATDSANCGFCGFHCIADVPCIGGTCQGGCVAPFKQCLNGTCCDESQCRSCEGGACVTWCDQPGMRCENNTCICDGLSCPNGCCTGGPAGGECKVVDFNTDPKNCGGCGNKCAAGLACVGGNCQGGCAPPLEACLDGTCCDTSQCQFCRQGTCVSVCQAGLRCVNNECICDEQSGCKGCCQGGQCVAPRNQNEDTCGAGGETCLACQPPAFCCGGSCCYLPEQAAGRPVCCWHQGIPQVFGTCVDVHSDPHNCGDCFHQCTADQHCVGGTCVCDRQTCPRGCCDASGVCQPGTTDQLCGRGGGSCGACGSGNHCVAGQCVCDGQSCPNFQCCENGPGNPGRCFITDDAHCAIGGAKCVDCGFLEECNAGSGQCQ